MATRQTNRSGLVGEYALAVAIIDQAHGDALGRNGREHVEDARRFFGSQEYRAWLDFLGLPPNARPVGLEDAN